MVLTGLRVKYPQRHPPVRGSVFNVRIAAVVFVVPLLYLSVVPEETQQTLANRALLYVVP
jgi:hypothetical protein